MGIGLVMAAMITYVIAGHAVLETRWISVQLPDASTAQGPSQKTFT
jgi:hypothetical protein